MGTDALLHTPELYNKILCELNCNGLFQYNKSYKVNIFEQYNCVVNCSHVKSIHMLCHHTTHQPVVYKIYRSEILLDHKLALCDGKLAHIIPLPPAEPPTIDAYVTIPRVTLLQAQDRQNKGHYKQPQYDNNPLVKQPSE